MENRAPSYRARVIVTDRMLFSCKRRGSSSNSRRKAAVMGPRKITSPESDIILWNNIKTWGGCAECATPESVCSSFPMVERSGCAQMCSNVPECAVFFGLDVPGGGQEPNEKRGVWIFAFRDWMSNVCLGFSRRQRRQYFTCARKYWFYLGKHMLSPSPNFQKRTIQSVGVLNISTKYKYIVVKER